MYCRCISSESMFKYSFIAQSFIYSIYSIYVHAYIKFIITDRVRVLLELLSCELLSLRPYCWKPNYFCNSVNKSEIRLLPYYSISDICFIQRVRMSGSEKDATVGFS